MNVRKMVSMLLAVALVFWALPQTAASGGEIVIDGPVGHDVYGNGDQNKNGQQPEGVWPYASATDNGVIVKSGGEVRSNVLGGHAWASVEDATAMNNSVIVESGGEVDRDVLGGHAKSGTEDATATDNSVIVESGGKVGGYVLGGNAESSSGDATATDNSVIVESGGEVGERAYGGYAGSSSGDATATDNSVIVESGGIVGDDVYGGCVYASRGTATGNTITISGGEVTGDVYGGYVSAGANMGTATGNTITISDGKVDGNVYGGYVYTSQGTATGNTVAVTDGDALGADTALYGGFILNDIGDDMTGNRLEWKTIDQVGRVMNFATIAFYLPADIEAGDTALDVTYAADLHGVEVELHVEEASALSTGDAITLINRIGGGFERKSVTTGGYAFELSMQGDALIATVTQAPPVITTAALPGGTVGSPYSAQLAASGDEPITWTIEGDLPDGLELQGDTISGTPRAAGTKAFEVGAKNAHGADTMPLSIEIAPAGGGGEPGPGPEPTPEPTPPTPPPPGGDGETADGSTPSKAAPAIGWMDAASLEALLRNAKDGVVRTSAGSKYGIPAAIWPMLAGYRYEHEAMDGGEVQVRLTIENPEKLAADTLVSAWVKGTEATRTRRIYERWFANRVRAVHLDHIGPWGQAVGVAAKVDLAGMDAARLNFYAYDRAANSYRRIAAPEYSVDADGYLCFSTPYGGSIVVSEGVLQRR